MFIPHYPHMGRGVGIIGDLKKAAFIVRSLTISEDVTNIRQCFLYIYCVVNTVCVKPTVISHVHVLFLFGGEGGVSIIVYAAYIGEININPPIFFYYHIAQNFQGRQLLRISWLLLSLCEILTAVVCVWSSAIYQQFMISQISF